MEKLAAVLRAVTNFIERMRKISSFLIVGVVLITLYEDVMRTVFNSPTSWAFEGSTFIYGAYAILAGGYVLRYNAHVNMDIIYSRLSLRGKAIMDSFSWTFFFLFIGLLLWKGWVMFWFSLTFNEHSQTFWGPILWPFKLTLPVGAFLILLMGMVRYIRTLFTAITGRVAL